MARQESDREDLIREATTLRERAEFRIPADTETVIAGYRSDGSLSVYFGAEPCFHFDPQCRLRRAFVDGDLYRAQGTTLARLMRTRTPTSVELRRHDLDPDELATFIEQATARLHLLHKALRADEATCLRAEPPGIDLRERLDASLGEILWKPLALAPAIRGRA